MVPSHCATHPPPKGSLRSFQSTMRKRYWVGRGVSVFMYVFTHTHAYRCVYVLCMCVSTHTHTRTIVCVFYDCSQCPENEQLKETPICHRLLCIRGPAQHHWVLHRDLEGGSQGISPAVLSPEGSFQLLVGFTFRWLCGRGPHVLAPASQ